MRNTLDPNIKNRINNNIKYLLKQHGISQSTLGKAIDKSVTHINALLNGQGTPTLGLIINICNYFNISIDSLVYEDFEENSQEKSD